jgi:subtilisin family serine protease
MRQINGTGGTSDGGTGSGTRTNALWGKGRKRYSLLLAISVLALAVAAGTTTAGATDISKLTRKDPAAPPAPNTNASKPPKKPFVPKDLKDEADRARDEGNSDKTFSVIIQTDDTGNVGGLDDAVDKAQKKHPGNAKGVKQTFSSIGSVSADLTADQLNDLSDDDSVSAITEDVNVHATVYNNPQTWVKAIDPQWSTPPWGTDFPTIAIIDSGVQSRWDFGTRLERQVDFTSGTTPNNGGDGFGHGTMVAGLASGEKDPFTGVEPRADIISLDVLDDAGVGKVSDVLAACDWLLQNRDRYSVRIANFSINAGSGVGIAYDPLNKAVEKLWLNGIVVVAAAGNYGSPAGPSGVGFAPANDPFVITVGASDTNNTETYADDFAAPWSAWGYTQDGFLKPELAAPGRMMSTSVQRGSYLWNQFPTRKTGDGYMWMSGTSFAAPLVSGAAATVLSRHPDWTPDQVKGALMASADAPTGYNSLGALGVGILDVDGSLLMDGRANPNAVLNQFVYTDPVSRLKSFNATRWATAAGNDAAWNAASWSSASWTSASWSSASWASASWSSASWASASWASASWASASWAQASWATSLAVE